MARGGRSTRCRSLEKIGRSVDEMCVPHHIGSTDGGEEWLEGALRTILQVFAKQAGSGPPEGPRSPPEPADRAPEADTQEPETPPREKTRALLRLGTPLAAMLLTLAAPLAWLLVERLPRLQPIVVVLVIFFAVLGLSVLLQLDVRPLLLGAVPVEAHSRPGRRDRAAPAATGLTDGVLSPLDDGLGDPEELLRDRGGLPERVLLADDLLGPQADSRASGFLMWILHDNRSSIRSGLSSPCC